MNHAEIKNQLDAYIDGEVSVAVADEIRLHLEGCGECRLHREEWLKMKSAFFEGLSAKGSESFVFKVMEDIRAEKKPVNVLELIRWTVPTFAIMAVALILITGVPFESDQALAVETSIYKSENSFALSDLLSVQKDETTDWMEMDTL